MATKLFVGSLPYSVTDEELAEIFKQVGNVVSAKVIIDRDTQRSKGFGFVEMSSEDEAQAAVKQLNGKEVSGRTIVVNEARSPEERGGGGHSYGGGRNNYGSNNRGNDDRY
jgi:RNA recognition motif-containing protein